ncbi:MAG: RNase adapter RapZ [Nitriliruptoraceae bacterium]
MSDAVRPRILVITGLSGAGRSTMSNVVEDLGWFVVDNLPPTLLQRVTELAFAPGSSVSKLAVVADVRGREFFDELVDAIAELRRSDVDLRVVFLEADDQIIHRRFEETRRRHPSADGGTVLDGIRRERAQLGELRSAADLILDTTDMNVHELRDRILGLVDDPSGASLRIEVVSFGFKHGTPRDADLQFDVRFLPNPHWVEALRPMTGQDAPVAEYVLEQPHAVEFLTALERLLDVVVPGYVQEGKRYLTIAIGCTGGRHRSVTLTERVAEHLRSTTELPVSVHHRDLAAS